MARSTYRGSYTPRAVPQAASEEKDDNGGLFGLGFGPDLNLGLGTALQELGQGVTGLLATGGSLLTPGIDGPGAAEFSSELGKRMLQSVAGTVDTLDPTGTVSSIPAALFGEDYRGEDFFNKAGDRGLLAALIEDVGNVALVGGLATAPIRGAALGAKALGATDDAARLTALHQAIKANPTVAAVQHPYRTTGSAVRTNVLKPALAQKLAHAGITDAPTPVSADMPATDTAAAAADTVPDAPTFEVDGEGQAASVATDTPPAPDTPPATAQAGLNLPDPIVGAFAKVEEFMQGKEAVKASRRELRIAEMERRVAGRDPLVQSAVTAAREHLVDLAGEAGETISRHDASEMIGEEVYNRVTGVKAAADEVRARAEAEGLDPASVEAALTDAGLQKRPIPASMMTPELDAALNDAADAQRLMQAKIRETLEGSRKGAAGFGPDDAMTPEMTGKQKAAMTQVTRLREKAAGLRGQIAREGKTLGSKRDILDKQIVAMDAEIARLTKQIGDADTDFARSRAQAPAGRWADEGLDPAEPGTPAQVSARLPNFTDAATSGDYYRSGRRGAKALAERSRLAKRKEVVEGTKVKVQQSLDELNEILDMGIGRTAAGVKQDKLLTRAQKLEQRVRKDLGTPSVARTPPRWQPVYQAFQELGKAAEAHPELATILADLPKTLGDVQRMALEKGFDPSHVRQFTPAQVRRLVFGNLTLGLGKQIKETEAGTRKARSGALTRAQAVERSVEAFMAASVEATLEARTNAVIDMIEKQIGRTIPEGGEIPKGWSLWSPTRTFLLTGTDVSETTGRAIQTSPTEGMIVPDSVLKSLRREVSDHDHPLYTSIQKVTSPWRTLVLTLSPAWYARNIVGNVLMAETHGVKIKDWLKAWESYRNTDAIGRFADTPWVTTDTLAQEAGSARDSWFEGTRDRAAEQESLVPKAGGFQGLVENMEEGGKVRGATRYAQQRLLRVNQVVDEFSRAAVYHKGRRLNMSPEGAWHHASEALVDYGNLSPFERKAVRSVIPFYSWQKGILKVTINQGLDHPARSGLLMQIGQMQEEYVADMLGVDAEDVPDYYKHLGMGGKNLRSWNPFADPTEILSPEGLTRSMNPFIELFIRKGLGAPEFFPDAYRLGQFGNAEADVSVPDELTNLLGSSPAGRVAGGGGGAVMQMGLHDQDLGKIRSRILRSRKQIRGIDNPETNAG